MASVTTAALFEHHLVSASSAPKNRPITPISILDNLVYPWSNESWSKSVRNRLEPAITLASILLQRAKPFLAQIFGGPIIQTSTSKYQLSLNWTAKKADYVLLDKAMLNFRRGGYRFCFLPLLPPDETDHLSETTLILDTGRNREGHKIFTGISQDLYNIISSDQFQTTPIANQRCVYAVLALTMIQELAHALWIQRWIEAHNSNKSNHSNHHETTITQVKMPPEPTVGHNRYRNLGMAISHELFGLEFTFPRKTIPLPGGLPPPETFNRRLILDGSAGLQAGTRDIKGKIQRRFTLANYTIRSFFDGSTWSFSKECDITTTIVIKLYLTPEQLEPDETLPSSDDDGPCPRQTKKKIRVKRSGHNFVVPNEEQLAFRHHLKEETRRRLLQQQF